MSINPTIDELMERQRARLAEREPVAKDTPPPRPAPASTEMEPPTPEELESIAGQVSRIAMRDRPVQLTPSSAVLAAGSMIAIAKQIREGTLCPKCFNIVPPEACGHEFHDLRPRVGLE